MGIKRENVLVWLRYMTEKQFVEFFYEAASQRETSEFEGDEGYFVLADTHQLVGEERTIDFLALPDTTEDRGEWADDSPLCQSGQCPECDSPVRSIAKRAICPVCGAKVYCT